GVHAYMTTCAYGILAVLLHPLAYGHAATILASRLQVRYVGRWRWRRRPQDVVEQPFAAEHWRRSIRTGRERQDARLPEETATFVVNRNSSKAAAVHVWNSVMSRESLVHERVIGSPE